MNYELKFDKKSTDSTTDFYLPPIKIAPCILKVNTESQQIDVLLIIL